MYTKKKMDNLPFPISTPYPSSDRHQHAIFAIIVSPPSEIDQQVEQLLKNIEAQIKPQIEQEKLASINNNKN